jgi:integrase
MDIDKLKNISATDIKQWSLESSGDSIKITTDGSAEDHQNALTAMRLLLQARASRYQEPPPTTPSQQASISAAMSTFNSATTLRWTLDTYYPVLDKTDAAIKTKKMAHSVLERLAEVMHADFDMQNFNDEATDRLWMQPRLLEVAGSTVKKELSWVRAFSEWAAAPARKYCPSPLTLTIAISKSKNVHYEYFNSHDLQAIFDALPDAALKPWQLWLPIIALYSGARVGEIAALQTAHFKDKVGLHTMHLPGTKTDLAARDIPMHPDLVAMGLLDLVKARRKAGKTMLFDITVSEQNGAGGAPSKWFGTFLREKAEVSNEGKVFHSFRHTLVDHLRQHGSAPEARKQFMGHSSGGGVHNEVYGREPLGLSVLNEQVVSKIDWQKYCGWTPDVPKLAAAATALIK